MVGYFKKERVFKKIAWLDPENLSDRAKMT